MTTNYHSAIATGEAANAATFNTPLGALDAAIAALDERIEDIEGAGYSVVTGNVATLTNGAASAGQKSIVVDSSSGFIVGGRLAYVRADGNGTIEYNVIAAIPDGTHLTTETNIGTGGIADNSYVSLIPASEYQAAQSVNHGNSYEPTLQRAIGNSGRGIYNALNYGADPAGSADSTAAIQAAIDAADDNGGVVELPGGIFELSSTLTINTKRGLRLRGVMQSYAATTGSFGTTLRWAGGTSDDMLYVFNSQDIRIEGITFDGADTAGSRAIFVDSDNVQVTKRIHIDHCMIRRCNIGIQFGSASTGTQYQVDSDYVTNCAFSEMYGAGSTCIHTQSQNVSYLNIENTEMAYAKYGLRVVRGGPIRMCNVTGGGDAAMSFVSVEGPVHNLLLEHCQAESVAYFLRVTTGAPSSTAPIALLQCSVDSPVQVDVTARILSLACLFFADVTLAGDDVEWASIFDYWTTGHEITKSGSSCRDYYLDGTTGLALNSATTSLQTIIGSAQTWEPGVIANGAIASEYFTVTGAARGDTVLVAHENVTALGLVLHGTVSSTNMIGVTLANLSGSEKTVASGTLRMTVIKQ